MIQWMQEAKPIYEEYARKIRMKPPQFLGDKYKAKIKPSKERELEKEEDPREDLEEDHKEEPKYKPSKLNEALDPYFDQ
ncbi:hypothetical protein GOBAR_DD10885 [Gossypium barbadense]|nr:hypothetical protein GOBAR_DD10885 [Gossypium barbadense]